MNGYVSEFQDAFLYHNNEIEKIIINTYIQGRNWKLISGGGVVNQKFVF